MSLKPIIADIADQADDFLEGVTTHADARAAVSKQLTIKYPRLPGLERGKVIAEVLSILDREGFFEFDSGSEGNGLAANIDDG